MKSYSCCNHGNYLLLLLLLLLLLKMLMQMSFYCYEPMTVCWLFYWAVTLPVCLLFYLCRLLALLKVYFYEYVVVCTLNIWFYFCLSVGWLNTGQRSPIRGDL